jgi:hypothetical protein
MSAGPPHRLGDQAFLLAYDVFKQRLIDQQWYLVRAAVLTDLFLLGRLDDVDGFARAIDGPMADPHLRSVLAEIAAAPPRSWQEWVIDDAWATYSAVRARLVTEGWVTVEDKKILRLFSVRKVTITDVAAVEQLITAVRSAVLADPLVDDVEPGIAALVALADAVDLESVFTRTERREHRSRIDELSAPIQPIIAGARAAFVNVERQTLSKTTSTGGGGM